MARTAGRCSSTVLGVFSCSSILAAALQGGLPAFHSYEDAWAIPQAPPPLCANGCSGHGVCISATGAYGLGTPGGVCACHPPWAGRDCSLMLQLDEQAFQNPAAGAVARYPHAVSPARRPAVLLATKEGLRRKKAQRQQVAELQAQLEKAREASRIATEKLKLAEAREAEKKRAAEEKATAKAAQAAKAINASLLEVQAAASQARYAASALEGVSQEEQALKSRLAAEQALWERHRVENAFKAAEAARLAQEEAKRATEELNAFDAHERIRRARERARSNLNMSDGFSTMIKQQAVVHVDDDKPDLSLLRAESAKQGNTTANTSAPNVPPTPQDGTPLDPLPPLKNDPLYSHEGASNSSNASADVVVNFPTQEKPGLSCANGRFNPATHTCVCDDGFQGEFCDQEACSKDCSSNGVCIGIACLCEEGFYGSSCQHQRCPYDCNNRGYCFQGRCQCTGDWGGESCTEPKHVNTTYHFKLPQKKPVSKGAPAAFLSTLRSPLGGGCADNCSSHGTCQGGKCECETDFFGETCASYCPFSCSSHGDCIHGSCLCYAGYAGPACDQVTCCSGHGKCDNSKPGVCECDEGWTGEDCSVQVLCPDPVCGGHGVCAAGKCYCGAGYYGPSCMLERPSCEDQCGDHGFCNIMTAQCICEEGYSGRLCDIPLYKCPAGPSGNACNNHGTCMDGACSCYVGWKGEACDVKDALPDPELSTPCVGGSKDLSLLSVASGCHVATARANSSSGVAPEPDLAAHANSSSNDATPVSLSALQAVTNSSWVATDPPLAQTVTSSQAMTSQGANAAATTIALHTPLTASWMEPPQGALESPRREGGMSALQTSSETSAQRAGAAGGDALSISTSVASQRSTARQSSLLQAIAAAAREHSATVAAEIEEPVHMENVGEDVLNEPEKLEPSRQAELAAPRDLEGPAEDRPREAEKAAMEAEQQTTDDWSAADSVAAVLASEEPSTGSEQEAAEQGHGSSGRPRKTVQSLLEVLKEVAK